MVLNYFRFFNIPIKINQGIRRIFRLPITDVSMRKRTKKSIGQQTSNLHLTQ